MSANDPLPVPENEDTDPESLDPNDSEMELDQLRGQTKLHAKPPRLEDEGQSGG
jgi:hypothetical protein